MRAALQQRRELGGGVDHVLEVVENEEQSCVADVLGEAGPRAERLRDRLDDERRVAQLREADPEDAVRVVADDLRRSLDREPRLSRAAGPRRG